MEPSRLADRAPENAGPCIARRTKKGKADETIRVFSMSRPGNGPAGDGQARPERYQPMIMRLLSGKVCLTFLATA